jgi:hypothetical protein
VDVLLDVAAHHRRPVPVVAGVGQQRDEHLRIGGGVSGRDALGAGCPAQARQINEQSTKRTSRDSGSPSTS